MAKQKVITTLVECLTVNLLNSLVASLNNLAATVRKSVTDDTILTRVQSIVTTARKAQMEDKGLLPVYVESLYGECGLPIPKEISALFTAAEAEPEPVAALAVEPAPKKVLEMPRVTNPSNNAASPDGKLQLELKKVVGGASGDDDAPARELKTKAQLAQEKLESWRGKLRQVVDNKVDGNVGGFFSELRTLTLSVFSDGLVKARADWELSMSAVTAAQELGYHIITANMKPQEAFKLAPVDLLKDHLFGAKGMVSLVAKEVSDCKGVVQGSTQSKASIVLDQILALRHVLPDRLDDLDAGKVRRLQKGFAGRDNTPRWLTEKFVIVLRGLPEAEQKPELSQSESDEDARKGVHPKKKKDRRAWAERKAAERLARTPVQHTDLTDEELEKLTPEQQEVWANTGTVPPVEITPEAVEPVGDPIVAPVDAVAPKAEVEGTNGTPPMTLERVVGSIQTTSEPAPADTAN